MKAKANDNGFLKRRGYDTEMLMETKMEGCLYKPGTLRAVSSHQKPGER